MVATLDRSQQDNERIRRTCTPCDYFLAADALCRLLDMEGSWFLKIFEDKHCDPRLYIEEFLVSRLSRRYGSVDRARPDAQDLASDIVLSLFEKPPEGDLLSADLTGMRRFLAARAVQHEIGLRRKVEGRMRCGNCFHHRAESGSARVCGHPDPEHPWSGKLVRASLDPRKFEPACKTYQARKRFESAIGGEGEMDPINRVADVGDLPDVVMEGEDRGKVLLEALRIIQMEDPKLSFVVAESFLKQRSNEDIAKELACSTKSVVRYKQRGLERLQEELARGGVEEFADVA